MGKIEESGSTINPRRGKFDSQKTPTIYDFFHRSLNLAMSYAGKHNICNRLSAVFNLRSEQL